MGSSRTVTLFSERADSSQRPSSFVVSFVLHALALTLLSLGIIYTPPIQDHASRSRYTIRHLAMHMPEPSAASHSHIPYPGLQPPAGSSGVSQNPQVGSVPGVAPGPQTLIQPKVTAHIAPKEEVPVPNVVLWQPEKVQAKVIVPPLPQRAAPADVNPSPEAPNDEPNLSDINISSADRAPQQFPILPSTTSPLTVRGPDPPSLPPQTASQSTEQPTPAAILSLSNLRMTEGTAALPPINESVRTNGNGMAASRTQTTGKGAAGAVPGSTSSGSGLATENTAPRPSNPGSTTQPQSARAEPPAVAPANKSAGEGNAAGGAVHAVARINLPKDGRFGAVVVGSSLEEKYPETTALWTGRMAYTVYLHVGLSKSWILQYSLPRAAEAAAAGNVGHIDAPWPYNIVRPSIAPGEINADALMVHGFVNESGRFESLAVAFPPDFSQAQFVLAALAQWQFRPAAQNGHPAKVEVLLIIPETE